MAFHPRVRARHRGHLTQQKIMIIIIIRGKEVVMTDSGEPARRWIPLYRERLDSRDLFRRSSCLFIEHGGELYQLRRTRSGKLILTK